MGRVELFGRCLAGTVTLAIVFSLIPSLAGAQALRFQPQGVAAAGQGNAFAAQADDPSAVHYNPGGLTQVAGIQCVFWINAVGGSVKFDGSTGG